MQRTLTKRREPKPEEREIRLTGLDSAGVFDRELRGARITGVLHDRSTPRACNVIESVLHSFMTERVKFTRCDFKDNSIRSCHFNNTQFDSSSFAYNTVVETQFEGCSFHDTDMQHCEFNRTVFWKCNLANLLVKGCTFLECEFADCETNNKVFETCRLTDCRFVRTELQVQTIAENFGITSAGYDGLLRDGRGDSAHKKLERVKLLQWATESSIHPLQRLSVEYFLKPNFLDGSRTLDQCFAVETLVPRSRTAGSFALVLSRWSEFLIGLYEVDQLAMHSLLQLHRTTDRLLQELEGIGGHTPWIAQVRGVHLSLARVVDRYLLLLAAIVSRNHEELHLSVEGGSTPEWYYTHLRPLFHRAPAARITQLRQRNSPWDMSVIFTHGSLLSFVALFLATRTRFEISRLEDKFSPASPSVQPVTKTSPKLPPRKKGPPSKSLALRPVLTLEFGGRQPLQTTPSFRLRAYLPGNLIGELQLDISSKKVGRLRKIIKDIL
jgi:hypothetical protein